MTQRADQPLRILHLIDSGGLYGAEKVLLTLAAESRALGHHVTIGTIVAPNDPGDPLGDAAKARGLEHVSFPMRDGFSIRGLRDVLAFATDRATSIIHSHGYRPNIMLACVPRRWRPCPIVTTLHGWTATGEIGKLAVYEALERRLLPRIDAVVIVSDSMRRRLSRTIQDGKVNLIPNGIDFAPFESARRGEDRAGTGGGKSSSTPVVLAIGRLSHEKGFDLLIRAAKLVHEAGVVFELLIVGEGPEHEALIELVTSLGLSAQVRFCGYVENVASFYADANLLVIPSRSEGLPLVLLETMASGVPVVATRVGEIPTVLGQGRYGALVQSGSPEALSEAMLDKLSNRADALEQARAGAEHVFSNYAGSVMARRYLPVYEAVAR